MTNISCIIVDDEKHNRDTLRSLIQRYCPGVQIQAEAADADSALKLILQHHPQLVFLDVMMPEKSGFDLLKMLPTISFEVIFVSAFNEFAVTSFDYNALGYILKPIDYTRLKTTVDRAVNKIRSGELNNVLQFVKTLDPQSDRLTKIPLHHNEKVVLVNIEDIICVKSIARLTHVTLTGNRNYYSSRDLKVFEEILSASGNFVRISRSVLVNLDHILSYEKGENCIVKMADGSDFEVSRRKKTEILSRLRIL